MWTKREGCHEPGGARLNPEQSGHLVPERLKGKREREVFGKVSVVGLVPADGLIANDRAH